MSNNCAIILYRSEVILPLTKNNFVTKENLKTNIRHFREQNNYTQTQLATIMGTDRTTYTKWESGDSMPNLIQLSMLASIYGRAIDDFYKRDPGFTVASPIFEKSGSSNFISELTKEEKMLLAEYRLLDEKEKKKVNKLIEKLKEKQKLPQA